MPSKIIMVGIDEAGYGPVLGPLVVSAAALEVPAERADECLWSQLKDGVGKTVNPRRGRVPIADSKLLYKPKEGLSRLEKSVLSAITVWRGMPPHLRGLLGMTCPELPAKLAEYPWYREANPELPRKADAGGLLIATSLLRRTLAEAGVSIAACFAEVLPEGHYNRLVNSTQNKAIVSGGLILRLMQRVADAYPDHEIRFCIDKQGGRDHYGRMLLQGFDTRRLRILEENERHSAYEMTDARGKWCVRFDEGGESLHLPTALASMLSKYLRELFMESFNDYWSRHAPTVKPTAGYYLDGHRFLKDIAPHVQSLGVDRRMLVRER
ncbi:MAG TPA: hypothetical protein VJZ71_09120 [Phycisphaerae bacterium]|nr:hypothetical protein [Phycisphaerae bacterium]